MSSQVEATSMQIPAPKTIKKSISNKKLIDIYSEINRPNVTVTSMVLKVTKKGEVIVESCEYEEVVSS
jgi:hypothetical protein